MPGRALDSMVRLAAAMILVSAAAADAGPAPATPADVIRALAAGKAPTRVCFAVSKDRRRVACALASWTNLGGNHQTIEILGDAGAARSEWIYNEVSGHSGPNGSYGSTPDVQTEPGELDAAREALVAGGYSAAVAPLIRLPNKMTARVGPWTIRRNRVTTHVGAPSLGNPDWSEYEEHVEVRCGRDRWVPLGIENDTHAEAPDVVLSRLNDRTVLVTSEADWTIEGESGGERTAVAVDVAALCKTR